MTIVPSILAQTFINTLAWWQWLVIAAVPPAIIALYFLKLRRQPLEVPSTYLWARTIEDLHVNSLWQRLRRSILLLLQLLLIALLIFACLRPGWQGATLTGGRYVFLIDNSASMNATDVSPSRLDEAKKRVAAMIDQMESGDSAMLISFSDRAQVVQSLSGNRRLLQRQLESIRPTNHTTDIGEALRVAAGLTQAEPYEEPDPNAPEEERAPPTANVFIFSDGGFPPARENTLGSLKPKYVAVGTEAPDNVGVVAFSTQRNPEKPGVMQVYARLENYSATEKTVRLSLYHEDELIDAGEASVPPEGTAGLQFDVSGVESGTLKIELDQKDRFPVDDVAYVAVNTPRRAKVLVVTPGNEYLRWALATDRALKLAEVAIAGPAILQSLEYDQQSAGGAFDLIVYDRCTPKSLPQSSTLFIGAMPPLDRWKAGEASDVPQIIDVDRAHPLMRFIELGNVIIAEGRPITPPQGGNVLIDADVGALLAIAPRAGFEDAVLGFEILGVDEETGDRYANTDWVQRRSFPLFVDNVLEYLGRADVATTTPGVKPGKTIRLRTEAPVDTISIRSPGGRASSIPRGGRSVFAFNGTEEIGVYDVREGGASDMRQQFAVNLFDSRESDIRAKPAIQMGYEEVAAQPAWQPMRQEAWKWFLLAAIVVLGAEWYIFNRRVYL